MDGVREREFGIKTGDAAAFSGQARGLSLPEVLSLGLRRGGGCTAESAHALHSFCWSVSSARVVVGDQIFKPLSSWLPDQGDWGERLAPLPKKALGGGLRKILARDDEGGSLSILLPVAVEAQGEPQGSSIITSNLFHPGARQGHGPGMRGYMGELVGNNGIIETCPPAVQSTLRDASLFSLREIGMASKFVL